MFRIRRIYDDFLPSSKKAISSAQEILRSRFPQLDEHELAKIPEQLRNPLKHRYRTVLFVADDAAGRVQSLALMLHVSDLGFCYLDFLASARGSGGRGLGGALYERLREESAALGSTGLFFECLPDDPQLCPDPAIRRQNAARLKFYERYGATPIANTAYETPCRPGDTCPPYLVFDDLGSGRPLSQGRAREIIRAILERKYGRLCPKEYVTMVLDSIRDDPVQLRARRYNKGESSSPLKAGPSSDRRIALIVTDQHAVHHVRERGYVESPVRIRSIMRELSRLDLFEAVPIRHYGERHTTAVHDAGMVRFFKRVCAGLPAGESVYPYVFPIRNASRPPIEIALRAGYYCVDTFTPLNQHAYHAALRAVDCALTGADELLRGRRLAYALVRPPGHHAEHRAFGGFCYFNSAAIAAHYLSADGKVAILDIDYHHGNGQQDIFYQRSDILTVSIHGHPRWTYPYFSGYQEERGAGAGMGYNLNIPLPEGIDGERFHAALKHALQRIARFKPSVLVLAFGLDTASGDPTGSWTLRSVDFESNGRLIGEIGLPILVVQEGGYDNRVLGLNARHFFIGLWKSVFGGEVRRETNPSLVRNKG